MSSAGNLPPDESDESDTENDPTSDEAILRLFISDTEGDDFSGFSAQEEEDSDQVHLFQCTGRHLRLIDMCGIFMYKIHIFK